MRAARCFRAARNFEALENLTVSVGATNVFDKIPNKRNDAYRALQFAGGDNGAVTQYPSFSPFGINGAYYYGRTRVLVLKIGF